MIKPLADRVLIRPLEAEAKTKSGIFIPDTAKEAPAQGKIVALGNGKLKDGKKHEFSVKIGDKVLYSKYSGDEIKLDNDKYLIIEESNILGIL